LTAGLAAGLADAADTEAEETGAFPGVFRKLYARLVPPCAFDASAGTARVACEAGTRTPRNRTSAESPHSEHP
jgi:hypothetical protein